MNRLRYISRRVFLFVFLSAVVFISPVTGDESDASGEGVFLLRPVKKEHLFSYNFSIEGREVVFRNEPLYEGGRIIRSVFPVGDGDNHICFAWDHETGLLHVDHNRNLDLTDDTDAVYRSRHRGRSYQLFKNIIVETTVSDIPVRYAVSIGLDRRNTGRCYLTVCSGWAGYVNLYGSPRLFIVADNLDGVLGNGDFFVICPVTEVNNWRKLIFQLEKIPVPQRLFFHGREYNVVFSFREEEGETLLAASFLETDTPHGKLKLAGYGISRLVLSAQGEGGTDVALYENPDSVVTVPARFYGDQTIKIDGGPLGPLYTSLNEPLECTGNTCPVLNAGCPLKNTAIIERRGPYLRFDYKLIGVGGEYYNVRSSTTGNPARFKVCRGDCVIGTGTFRYG